MDYEQLYVVLPKLHWQWSVRDTTVWLNYIGLQCLQQKFEQLSVDGSILGSLTEEDMVSELHITSKIMLKKLMNWIRNGLPEFDRLVGGKGERLEESLRRSRGSMGKGSLPFEEVRVGEEREGTEHPRRCESNELIIKNIEQNQSNYFLKEKGGMIGRQNTNEIVILDEFVSRHHAEIIYQREQYFIRDCGSSSGTFLKITEKMELKRGMIIEMGSNQFEVRVDGSGGCAVAVVEGPNQEFLRELVGGESYSFGRKESNYVCFPDDQHLSGIHSKIFRVKGRWFIEDIATTNGTWLRLSPEGEESEAFLLEDRCQFKLSSNLIYECKLNTNNRKTNKHPEDKCLLCRLNDKDAIIMPCKHAVGCWHCLSLQKECPICQTPILSIIKIFTA